MCRIAFIFWHYGLYESCFNAYSRPAIQKNVILLEFYKQQFKQGCFMLLLLTFYNEEATYWPSEVKLQFASSLMCKLHIC